MSYVVNQPKVKDDIVICERFTRSCCQGQCALFHHPKNYIWQVYTESLGWLFVRDSDTVEQQFKNPANEHEVLQTDLLAGDFSSLVKGQLLLNFMAMNVEVTSLDGQFVNVHCPMRRLSTPSYMLSPVEKVGPNDTWWTWYWQDGQQWKIFGKDSPSPLQCVIEAKYLGGQEIVRFELDAPGASCPLVFLLNVNLHHLKCVNDGKHWKVTRRPSQSGAIHSRKSLPYPIEYPDNWTPIDVQHDFEIVPLNPDSLEHHLVASEFFNSLKSSRTILDVFRIQNPFLWFKYHSKRLHMKAKGKNPNERQLFHGTSDESAVQSIFRQNFDWRMAGKNATMYGRGAYFATDANLSDRYTGPSSVQMQKRWMFMARVMIGKYTTGHRDYNRPPPLDPAKPHGDLYDSCVDCTANPNMHIVFDTDQCYPEYAICYQVAPQTWGSGNP